MLPLLAWLVRLLMMVRSLAAFVSLTSAPSGASADTVYGIVSDAKGAVKIDGTYYTEFAVDTFE